jgi:restriction system protein
MGDLSLLPVDREAFKERIVHLYPDKKPGAVPVDAGQLYRFVHEIQIGDLIIYPSKRDRKIHIGKVKGKYRYVPKAEEDYPHQRKVSWLKVVPRTHFSQGALYEIGSAMSFSSEKLC